MGCTSHSLIEGKSRRKADKTDVGWLEGSRFMSRATWVCRIPFLRFTSFLCLMLFVFMYYNFYLELFDIFSFFFFKKKPPQNLV